MWGPPPAKILSSLLLPIHTLGSSNPRRRFERGFFKPRRWVPVPGFLEEPRNPAPGFESKPGFEEPSRLGFFGPAPVGSLNPSAGYPRLGSLKNPGTQRLGSNLSLGLKNPAGLGSSNPRLELIDEEGKEEEGEREQGTGFEGSHRLGLTIPGSRSRK
ncbi:hypothetical protein SLEP1_g10392 [Rubroshorea leprosula]|uniref:Uncharacterized protein n=1 Tax=Rubroshorea leprosula TaxID=152421 RepID=A0AAV5I7Z4_9ROSI|nr:hypothetical protein SLEP1_g10392 [Rubroshorea leprosula]